MADDIVQTGNTPAGVPSPALTPPGAAEMPPPLMQGQVQDVKDAGAAQAGGAALDGDVKPQEAGGEPLPPPPMAAPESREQAGAPAVDGGAPEQYTPFNVPEGYDISPEVFSEAGARFRELGMSQANAQKMIDLHCRMLQQQEAVYRKQIDDSARKWYGEIHSRPEYAAEQGLVNRGIAAVVKTKEQAELFRNPTFAYSPLIWDIFREVGKLVSEDTIGGRGTQSAPPADDNPYHINI